MVGTSEFMLMRADDRMLAKALGLSVKVSNPFKGSDLINYLSKLRDDEEDKLLKASLMSDDPMAEDVLTDTLMGARSKAMIVANLPPRRASP